VVLAACGPDSGNPDSGTSDAGACSVTATFASLHDDLFATPRCAGAGCHSGTAPEGELDLASGRAATYTALLDGATTTPGQLEAFPRRVTPTEPIQSYLFIKVTSPNPGGLRGRMPPGAPLATCEMKAVENWIESGAAM
jgi:hypothetical protein